MAFTSKKFNRFMATGATAALVVSAIVPVVSAEQAMTAAFTDVAPQYEEAVDFVVSNNIARGFNDTQFGVNKEIIRGDAAIMVAQAAGMMDEDAPLSGFTDVPARGQLAINTLKAAGVINGKSATEFDFHSNITRGEAALMLAKAFELTGNTASTLFTDVIGTRYDDAVAALVDNEVTNGISTTQFGTYKNIKRGDFARFFYRLAEEGIEDTEVPVLNYEGDTNLGIELGGELTWPKVTATDNVDSEVEVRLVITDETGKEIAVEDFSANTAGTYRFIYSAVDKAGNKAENIVVTVTITETAPIEEFTFLELKTPYISLDNKMTVTMENLEVVDMGDFYEIQFTYNEQNSTTDQAIDQGAFKIYYANGDSEPQYGFFDKLYPGEEETRNYTFKALKSQEVIAIEYGADLFFKQEPTEDTLKWNVEFPS